MATLCGTPASLLSNWIWKAAPAGALTLVCSKAILSALIETPPAAALAGALAGAEAATLGGGVTGGAGV